MKTFALILLSFLSCCCFSQSKKGGKNIIIIYADDHSYHALGGMGNIVVKTPNLDKLAASGMMFTQTHVMGGHQGAVCIPSRVMLLTGRYVNRLPGDGGNIPDSLISLPEVLRSMGYTTYHTGKWHSDKSFSPPDVQHRRRHFSRWHALQQGWRSASSHRLSI